MRVGLLLGREPGLNWFYGSRFKVHQYSPTWGTMMYNKEGPSTTRKTITQNNTNHASKGVQEELSKFVHKLDISPHQL